MEKTENPGESRKVSGDGKSVNRITLEFIENGVRANGAVTRDELEDGIAALVTMYKIGETGAGVPLKRVVSKILLAVRKGLTKRKAESGTLTRYEVRLKGGQGR